MNLDQWERHLRSVYERHKEDLVAVPHGKSGSWEVAPFEVELDLNLMRMQRDGRGAGIGRYTKLRGPRGLFMTDTPAEVQDIAQALPWSAGGSLLVSGLGLGLLLHWLVRKGRTHHATSMQGASGGRFTHITVLEKEPDVVALVAPTYLAMPQLDGVLRVICADAFTWEPDRRFDWAWHDIWPDMCADYLPQMAKLRRHYARHMTAPKRQLCWAEHQMRRNR